jgi:pyrrolysine biosynthesis protein PylD
MTRLTTNDIDVIGREMANYDRELTEKTGRTLLGIGCCANGCEEIDVQQRMAAMRLSVVTMTCGEGIIGGFVETVKKIAGHMGVLATIPKSTDASGIAEAMENQATHVMMADDHRFVILDLINRRVLDNSVATGRGFATGLDLMVPGGLHGKKVLVVGCGPVGQAAAKRALELQAKITLCDCDHARCLNFAKQIYRDQSEQVSVTDDLDVALKEHSLAIEASNAGAIIDVDAIFSNTYIAAPGMPIGLTEASLVAIGRRILHDPLQIGVATMIVSALLSP